MKKLQSILWGIALVAVGSILSLNVVGLTDIDIFFDGWWTLFIIVPCAIGLFSREDKTGNFIGLLVGVALLLSCQDVISFSLLWKLAIPAVIIFIGIKIILKTLFGNKTAKIVKQLKDSGKQQHNGFAAFSGTNVNFDGQCFYGGEVNALFGGVKYDLTGAVINQDCVIDATAIFGGADILLPDYVNAKTTSTSIFGGVSNKHVNRPENTVTVYINGTALFGGVDIK